MTTIINGSSPSITFSDGSAQTSATRPFQNRIINGAMVIDQRATAITASGYTVDRFAYFGSQASKVTIAKDTSVYPTGFNASLKVLSSSAYTVGSTEEFEIYQSIEGFNVADLGFGTANAKTVTLSFQVYSSLTGTFGGALQNSAGNRSYPFTYSIPTANTWTTISVTIAGDTSGTWGTGNGIGIAVYWGLGVGSTKSGTVGAWAGAYYTSATGATSVVGTNGATFYITGVQLEVGSTATSFDYRPYGTELALCQRYYLKSFEPNTAPANSAANGINSTCAAYNTASTFVSGVYVFPAQMRAIPTVTFFGQNGATGHWDIFKSSAWAAATTTQANTPSSTQLNVFLVSSSLVAGDSYPVSGNFTASAEL